MDIIHKSNHDITDIILISKLSYFESTLLYYQKLLRIKNRCVNTEG